MFGWLKDWCERKTNSIELKASTIFAFFHFTDFDRTFCWIHKNEVIRKPFLSPDSACTVFSSSNRNSNDNWLARKCLYVILINIINWILRVSLRIVCLLVRFTKAYTAMICNQMKSIRKGPCNKELVCKQMEKGKPKKTGSGGKW